jgi:hypothetical protein
VLLVADGVVVALMVVDVAEVVVAEFVLVLDVVVFEDVVLIVFKINETLSIIGP